MTAAKRLATALSSLPALPPVDTALILGSGLGGLADAVQGAVLLPYAQIAGFPVSTAPGHAGRLVFGRLFGRNVVLMQGRVHLYEGWQPQDIALAVYLLARLGAKRLIVTNAAGALNPTYAPGEVMTITDHLNFTGVNPLTGPNDDAIGVRFPDLSRAYDPGLLAQLRAVAQARGVRLHEGIYAGVAGPSLETSAERRFFRSIGADAVGMSTVLEVIAAAHVGLPVLGLSAISNAATGGPDQQPDTIEQVLAHAAVAGRVMMQLLEGLLPELQP
ncbi:purine-nucleoside phosphorylase [Rhodobacter ferrooxidans]|uniref:Purine nucleoside phosphorylase n=1 Tax=Rhodobacter ferrooxidans TaxID=371731 RepID=C8S291_9RHOB|nr:purine-nucleoside phosphorylase [Rhodobacter sp. SW2]EEW24963.1 inosine guanosine and xanthosine phosphorylase family [Rhodobacter sp. SW2]